MSAGLARPGMPAVVLNFVPERMVDPDVVSAEGALVVVDWALIDALHDRLQKSFLICYDSQTRKHESSWKAREGRADKTTSMQETRGSSFLDFKQCQSSRLPAGFFKKASKSQVTGATCFGQIRHRSELLLCDFAKKAKMAILI